MGNWSQTLLSVGAMALAQLPSHALGTSMSQICQSSGQSGYSSDPGLEFNWLDSLKFRGNTGPVVVQKKVSGRGSSDYADVVYDAGSGPTILLRLADADIHSWEARLGLIELSRRPAILGAVTEAGMRYVGVALWTLFGPQPHRIGLVAGYRRVLLRRVEMGGGPVWSGDHGLIFTNPRIECTEGEAWLIEEWSVLGQQGVACWKFEGGNVAPLVVYRNRDDDHSEIAGARIATITRIVRSAVGPRATTVRMSEPKDMAEGLPTCDELLQASDKAAGVRK